MALVRSHLSQNPISKAKSLQFFVSSIGDPLNPQHCAVCLDGAFRECTDAEEWQPGLQRLKNRPGNKGVSKYNPELWNAVVGFLFVKRTQEQMESFLTRLMECTCRMDEEDGDVGRYHQISMNTPMKPPEERFRGYNNQYEYEIPERRRFIEPWRLFLFNLFNSLSVLVQLSGLRSSAKGSSTSWPHSSTDLIPNGADTLVESIIQWYQFSHDPLLFNLMGNVLRVCQELVIPSLVKYKFTTMVVESTKEMVDRMVWGQVSETNSEQPSPLITEFFLYIWPWQSSGAIFYLTTCSIIMWHEDHKAALYQGCEVKAMQLCSLIIYMFYPLQILCPEFTYRKTDFVRIGQELFRFFHMQRPSQPAILVHPFIKELDDEKYLLETIYNEVKVKAFNALRVFRLDMRCSSRGCTNSLRTVGNNLQRCAKCGIVAYCGRDCQKQEWKDEDYPHKSLCPILTKLVEKVGGYDALLACTRSESDAIARVARTIEKNWDKAKVDHGDLKFVADWHAAVNASRTIAALDQKELSPGFCDYEAIIIVLCANMKGRAPLPVYLNHRTLASRRAN